MFSEGVLKIPSILAQTCTLQQANFGLPENGQQF